MEEEPFFYLRNKQDLSTTPFYQSDIEDSAQDKSNWYNEIDNISIDDDGDIDPDYTDENTYFGKVGFVCLRVNGKNGEEVVFRQDIGLQSNEYPDGCATPEIDQRQFELLDKNQHPVDALNMDLTELQPDNSNEGFEDEGFEDEND